MMRPHQKTALRQIMGRSTFLYETDPTTYFAWGHPGVSDNINTVVTDIEQFARITTVSTDEFSQMLLRVAAAWRNASGSFSVFLDDWQPPRHVRHRDDVA